MTRTPEARPLSDRVAEGFAYALSLHRGQFRKGTGIPYLSHLMAVASLVMESGGDEDQVVAALLHDGPEDQGGGATLEEIRRRFGPRVARIVEECSDTLEQPKPPWRERKERYLGHLATASRDALLVSAADKLHNLRSIVRDFERLGDALWSRFTAGRDEQIWYFERLVETYRTRGHDELAPLADALHGSLAELRTLVGDAEGAGSE